MIDGAIPEGLTFDDVLLLPGKSSVLPTEVNTQTQLTRKIAMNIPLVSGRDGYRHRIAPGHCHCAAGRPRLLHRSMPIERQAEEVDRVKRSESGMIVDPVTISPEQTIPDALDIMSKLPRLGPARDRGANWSGILTNRDLRFETTRSARQNVMTKENLSPLPWARRSKKPKRLLHHHRVEKLLVVDDDFNLKGLITVKDIQKKLKYPNAAKDEQGRLRVGAASARREIFWSALRSSPRKKWTCWPSIPRTDIRRG